jgi:hypothetical protein
MLMVISVAASGRKEILHGGHCSSSGHDSYRGCYSLSCMVERLQTEVGRARAVRASPAKKGRMESKRVLVANHSMPC